MQQTKIKGKISEKFFITHGLPQGSKLSNLLFILYINDLPIHIPNVKVNLYADDSLIYSYGDSLQDVVNTINSALSIVGDWLKFNSMALNIQKCNAMFLNTKEDLSIMMDEKPIEIAKCVKYLGIWIDNSLSFNIHVEKLKAKINQRVGLLRRLSDKMTRRSKEIFLKSLILPLYDYCSSLLMTIDDFRLNDIQKCINIAYRTVLCKPKDTSIKLMLEQLKVLPVSDRIKLNMTRLIHSTVIRKLPVLLSEKLISRSDARQRNLRTNSEICLPRWNTLRFRRSMFYEGVKLFNECKKLYDDNNLFLFNCKNYIKSLNQ